MGQIPEGFEVELDKREARKFLELASATIYRVSWIHWEHSDEDLGLSEERSCGDGQAQGHRKERRGWMKVSCRTGHLTCFWEMGFLNKEVRKGVSAMLIDARVCTENIWVRHILQNTNMIQNNPPSSWNIGYWQIREGLGLWIAQKHTPWHIFCMLNNKHRLLTQNRCSIYVYGRISPALKCVFLRLPLCMNA